MPLKVPGIVKGYHGNDGRNAEGNFESNSSSRKCKTVKLFTVNSEKL